jgi:integrase
MGKLKAIDIKRMTAPGRYGDGDGLWLQVRSAENRSWLYRYMMDGRARQMGLGHVDLVTLAEAREATLKARRLVQQGIDPLDAKAAQKAARRAQKAAGITFRQVVKFYLDAHQAAWKNLKHRAQWSATLETYALPYFGDLPVGDIETGHVLGALEPIWREKPETASRVRGRIEAILDYAKARDWRHGENPARWKGHLSVTLPARAKVAVVEHHPALPWQQVGAFLVALDGQAGMAAQCLRFAILTAARSGEARGARWSEIDLRGKIWAVPGSRMKAGRDHRVPLSAAALAVLAEMAKLRQNDADALVFPGSSGKPLSDMTMTALLRRMNATETASELPPWRDAAGRPIVVHGFRSTFRVWAAEATRHQREVAEAALAHVVGDKVEAAYQRGDLFEKRRVLMADWAAFCGRVLPAEGGQVVPMMRAKSA